MSKISVCPVCETSIQPDTEQCPTCRWIIMNYLSLDREKYHRLVDWAIDAYKELDELRSRGAYNKKNLIGRLNRQRDDIDRLQKQVDQILMSMQDNKSNSPETEASIVIKDNRSSEENLPQQDPNYSQLDDTQIAIKSTSSVVTINYDVMAPMDEMYGANQRDIERSNSSMVTVPADQDNYPQQSEVIGLDRVQTKIVTDYYHDQSNFDYNYHPKTATITKETINNNWTNEQKVLILTEADRGNYWIFEIENICYLVPYSGKYFNQHSYQTLSAIFECENYIPDYNRLQLLAAAIVTSEGTTSPQTWRLQVQGKLFFH